MRKPIRTTLDDDELELVDAATERSRCNSRSEFIRSASLLIANQVLPDYSENEEDERAHD